MKRWIAVLGALALLAGVLSAQEKRENQNVFAKTLPITKIYGHAYGYRVLYMKSNMDIDEFYVPSSWFEGGGRAEIIYGDDRSLPYFTVFWIDGKFSHIRLYVYRNIMESSWGMLQDSEGLKQKFQVEELKISF